jgi:glycosyltransferase involved in cell wall biosynthesis
MTIALLITTYNRADTLAENLHRVGKYIKYDGKIEIVIADDGSNDHTELMLSQNYAVHFVQTDRKGLGANTNNGLRKAFSLADTVIQFQDDVWIDAPLDLTPHVERLKQSDAGWIRLGRIANHNLHAELNGEYWRVNWHSPEIYIASDQPHLKHKRFHDMAGYYPEGMKIGDTENAWCGWTREIGIKGELPSVLIPVDVPNGIWRHVGASWQSEGL